MKVFASYILHYGREWLRQSIKSVVDQVDEVHLFYTPWPSHGHDTTLHNPEERDDLVDTLPEFRALGKEVCWHECHRFHNEGEHREWAVEWCKFAGADIVIVVDADEIWPANVLKDFIAYVANGQARSYRIGMRHFWRSLKYICDDPAMPTRGIKPNVKANTEDYFPFGKVFHMGYAQSPAIIKYKMSIHGHKNELRPGWFDKTFMTWRPGVKDVHPTNVNFWNPQPYTDKGELEKLVGDHGYWNQEIIE